MLLSEPSAAYFDGEVFVEIGTTFVCDEKDCLWFYLSPYYYCYFALSCSFLWTHSELDKVKLNFESQQSLFVVLKTNLVVVKTKFASSTRKFSFHNNQISFQ